jgi:hypothetical protein
MGARKSTGHKQDIHKLSLTFSYSYATPDTVLPSSSCLDSFDTGSWKRRFISQILKRRGYYMYVKNIIPLA